MPVLGPHILQAADVYTPLDVPPPVKNAEHILLCLVVQGGLTFRRPRADSVPGPVHLCKLVGDERGFARRATTVATNLDYRHINVAADLG